MAFLEVITRTYQRPTMLERNRASLARQTDGDWLQTILPDPVGHGIGWAQEQLASYAGYLRGDYVWILDDDDICVHYSLVEELKAIVDEHDPDVVMVRMNHGGRGTQPDDHSWRQPPVCGRIGCSAYIVRREVWQQHAPTWASAHYASDFDFIHAIFEDDEVSIYWHDVIASEVQMIGFGVPE